MSEFRGSRFDAGARETSSFFRPFDGPLFVNRTTVKGDPWTRLDCHGTTIWLHRETGEHRVQPEHPDAPRQSGATRVAPEEDPVPRLQAVHYEPLCDSSGKTVGRRFTLHMEGGKAISFRTPSNLGEAVSDFLEEAMGDSPAPSVEVGHGCDEKICDEKPNDCSETLIYLTFHDERFFALVTKFKAEGLSPHLAVQAAFRLVTLYP